MKYHLINTQLANFCVALLGMALLTTVAGTNILVLLLLMTAPIAWFYYKLSDDVQCALIIQFFMLILCICFWDVVSNIVAGYSVIDSFRALLHDMRTIGFVLLLWPVFSSQSISRTAFWALLGSVVTLATVNLILTVVGYLSPGQYFWPTAPHLYGQILVGFFYVLAQIALVRPALSWRVYLPMILLLLSLFFASERRTGYLQLAAGLVIWTVLNYKRLVFGKFHRWYSLVVIIVLMAALLSPIVQRRVLLVFDELQQFMNQVPEERTTTHTSIGIRMQYYVSVIQLIKESNWWVGVGTIDFQNLFWKINERMGGMKPELFRNPHNEYLYMLATKGVVGLALYLAIFVQACRIAWGKKDEIQRIGLVMFVFFFMLSITTNSMMIDMEEGHFTMLIFLIFLAPKSLDLIKRK